MGGRSPLGELCLFFPPIFFQFLVSAAVVPTWKLLPGKVSAFVFVMFGLFFQSFCLLLQVPFLSGALHCVRTFFNSCGPSVMWSCWCGLLSEPIFLGHFTTKGR